MMAIVLAEHANEPVDILKVVKMVLIHDIVEIDAGDTFIYDAQKNHSNTDEERLAAQRIFGILPNEQAKELIATWEEFEAGEKRRKQNLPEQWTDWNLYCKILLIMEVHGIHRGVNYTKVYAKKVAIKDGAENIWEFAEGLINDSVEKGILKKE